MRSRRIRWVSGLGVLVLIGTLVMANYGAGVPQAGAQAAPPNPLTVILDKVNQILAAIGNIQEGNHTLRWDTNNPSASRFVTAFPGAVLDKNTGLVWEQAPSTTARALDNSLGTTGARVHCAERTVGGTTGWRLPSVAELKSVQDRSLPNPFVPASIFTGISPTVYWTASIDARNPTTAVWVVNFSGALAEPIPLDGNSRLAWCVRGPMQESLY